MTSKLWVAVTCACAAMGFPASAAALVTTSTISAPGSGWLVDDQVSSHEAITVAGSTNGIAGDAVDINCYSGATGSVPLASNVPVAAGGSFTATIAQGLRALAKETCVLRAVPAGDNTAYPPGGTPPFTGPTLSIDQVLNATGGSGQLQYYSVYAAQLMGAFEFRSLGNCSVAGSFVYDSITFGSVPLDACSGGFSSENSTAAPTRSELRVDGANAYVAGNAFDIAGFHGAGNSGYPSLTYHYSIDPATGNLVLDEVDHVVKCSPGGSYPPNGTTCPRFVPTGVDVRLHITQAQGGRMATVVQYFSSTDSRAHTLDLLEGNQFRAPGHDGELGFPWIGAGLAPYTQPGQVLPGSPRGGPGSFFVKGSASVPDGSEASAQGSVSFSDPPSSVTIVQPTTSGMSWLELGYTRAVPAGGTTALAFTYSDAFYASEVAVDAAFAEAAFRPSVTIAFPANGTTTSSAHAIVSGVAADPTGLSAVTVDGRLATVAPDGTWTAAVPLRPGLNIITADAINVFGNVTQAQASVMFRAPRPRLWAVSESRRVWREGGASGGHRPPIGTTFRFSLNEAAPVALAFTRQLVGRTVAHRCVLPSVIRRGSRGGGFGGRPGRRCLLTATVATTSVRGHPGRNRVQFAGIVNGRALEPGRYTLVLVANDAGVLSRPRLETFTIVP